MRTRGLEKHASWLFGIIVAGVVACLLGIIMLALSPLTVPSGGAIGLLAAIGFNLTWFAISFYKQRAY